MNFKKFAEDPFGYVDEINLNLKGRNLNILQKTELMQKLALCSSIFFMVCWIIFGFDSTPLQFIHVLYEGIPAWIQGKAGLQDLIGIYNLYYGKEMHYSAFVIYFLLWYFLSKSWEAAGVTKSKNFTFSCAGMLLGIAAFEWFWILSFATFQNQPWVATWRFPQMKILLQNLIFSLAGGITLLYMLTERWHWKGKQQLGRAYYFRMSNWAPWILLTISILSAIFWIYYPFHVDPLTVQLATGEIWQNSRLFPQTLYTIDLNPTDGVNAGEWFWIENDMIHAVNTIVKVFWAMTTYYVFRVRKPE